MSIAKLLYRQSLLMRKNDLQFAAIQANQARYDMLNSINFGSLKNVSNKENLLNLQGISNSTELMAINSELNALNDCSINYFA